VLTRRRFLFVVSASVLVTPLAGGAQPGRVYRVGVVFQGGSYSDVIGGLRDGLKERGLEDGKQVVFLVRDARGDLRAVEAAARTLEAEKVDVIYAIATSVAVAAKRATKRVPIVFYAGTDPIAVGLVQSFRKPGGRLTGVHGQITDLTPKRLQLLKEMIPSVRRVVTFYNPENPAAVVARPVASVEELRALGGLRPGEVDAYFHMPDAMVTSQTDHVVEATNAKRLPAMFNYKDAVMKGALASYGESYYALGRLSAKRPAGSAGRRSRHPARRAVRPAPIRPQPQDRQGARPHDPAIGAGAGGSRRRVRYPGPARLDPPGSGWSTEAFS